MKRTLLAGLLLAAPAFSADLLTVSRFAFGAGQVADAVSSIGLEERNPLLRSANGQFGFRGMAIKGSIGTAVLVAERGAWFRRHPRYTAALNFAGAGVGAWAAIHNARIR
jgi:hypothetical protein